MCLALLAGGGVIGQNSGPDTARISQAYGGLPPYFEENQGQADAQARYVARTGNLVAFLTQDGWTVSLHGEAISMRIAAADRKAQLTAEDKVKGISNYYLGSRKITELPHYASVRVADILPGIDILYHASERELEYDFVIRPGANPNALRLRFEGGIRPELAGNGDLLFKTSAGQLLQRKPRVWQETGGKRRYVDCRYALAGPGEVRLILANYNRSAELVVDPVLSYSTYLGGMSADVPTGIAVDSNGYAYVTGYTASTDFPVTTGSFHGSSDVFVTKLNASGSGLVYSTFIGGVAQANAIAIDSAGNAYVTGFTFTGDFPFTIGQYIGANDAFVLKLGSTGIMVYCTALSGSASDNGTAIAVDASGSAYVAGYTYSNDFPATMGSYKTTLAGGNDAFVAKLLPSGQISYATYLGGASYDSAHAIAIDSSGNAFVAGSTASSNFPVTTGAYTTSSAGGSHGFIAKLNSAGSALVYSTYFGGSSYDDIFGLAVDAAGNSYVAGVTTSSDFPTTPGAFATTKPSVSNTSGFAAKLNALGAALVYSTFLGGNFNDAGVAIAVDLNGAAFVAGIAESTTFPTTPGSLRPGSSNSCCAHDMFLVKLSVDGSALSYSTLLGTANSENASALALDGNGGVYITGSTFGATYPTTVGAYQAVGPKPVSGQTAVVSKIDFSSATLCNPSVSPLSQSVPGRGGAIAFNLTLSPGCPWEAVADSFITVSAPTHGVISTSPITLSGTVGLNDSTFSGRTGTVRIGPATFTVNQDAGSCQDPVLSPPSVAFDSNGGIRQISLTLPSSCQWVAVASSPWLSVPTNPSGNGSASITVFAGQNSFSPRTATLTIAGKQITVTQSGSTCTATASGAPLSYSGQGGTGIARITTNSSACQWTAYNIVPWIQIAALSNTGQGSGSVPFIVAANPGSLPRTGQILIADQTLTITQSAGPAGAVSGFTLSTFAGGGASSAANRGDGGPALGAYLNNPYGLAFDPATGNLYVADNGNARVRVVTPDGNINTIAGGGSATGENVSATSALLKPANTYVAVDNNSSVYINDSFTRVRAISQGNIATFAGTTSGGLFGDGGAATSAKLSNPMGIAADTAGNVYLADYSNNRIRRVNGGTITTFAGGGNSGLGDNGPATSAALQSPQGIAVDTAGSLYIADVGNGRIRKVLQSNISTVAGGGNGGDGGPATSAFISNPFGVAVDPLGDILVIEAGYNRIRLVSLDGKISTVAGNGVLGYFGLSGIATDTAGNVYFTDYSTGTVRKLTALTSFCNYTVGTPSMLSAASGALAIPVTTTGACNWTAASDLPWLTISSGSPGTGTGSVNFTVASNPSSSARTGTIVIAGQAVSVTQAGTVPSALSVIPNSGSGTSQTFQFQFSDTGGASDLVALEAWFTPTSASALNTCLIYYGTASHLLYLSSDDTSSWSSQTIGAAGTLQNSQCTLNVGGATATPSGNNLTLSVPIAFQPGFAGSKQIFMFATGSANNTGWQIMGHWTTSTATASAVSVTPSSGSGTSQTFQFQASDSGGNADLVALEGWITPTSATAVNTCLIYYATYTHLLYLASDDTSTWSSQTIGTAGTLQNSQCTLNGGGATVTPVGNNLTLSVPITFKAGFAGFKQIFMFAAGTTGNSGWQILGNWTPSTATASAVSVIPNFGNGSSQTFKFQASDSGGAGDIVALEGWFATTSSTAANTCLIYYANYTHLLYLASDDTSTWSSQVIGTAGTLQNSQCMVNVGGATATPNGNFLTLSVPITFQPGFAGAKQVLMFVAGTTGNSGWQKLGTWATFAETVNAVSVTPNAGSGTSQTFQFVGSSSGGAADLVALEGWFTASTSTPANSCLIYYDTNTELLFLALDDASGWTSRTIGNAGTLQNSQCSLNVGAATATPSGNNLTLSVPVTFKPAFAGPKQIFLYAGATNAASGFQNRGTWTAP